MIILQSYPLFWFQCVACTNVGLFDFLVQLNCIFLHRCSNGWRLMRRLTCLFWKSVELSQKPLILCDMFSLCGRFFHSFCTAVAVSHHIWYSAKLRIEFRFRWSINLANKFNREKKKRKNWMKSHRLEKCHFVAKSNRDYVLIVAVVFISSCIVFALLAWSKQMSIHNERIIIA